MFMPVKATVKTQSPEELKEMGSGDYPVQYLSSLGFNRDELIARAGGLHKFMNWDQPIFDR